LSINAHCTLELELRKAALTDIPYEERGETVLDLRTQKVHNRVTLMTPHNLDAITEPRPKVGYVSLDERQKLLDDQPTMRVAIDRHGCTAWIYQLGLCGECKVGFIEDISTRAFQPALNIYHSLGPLQLTIYELLKATELERHDVFRETEYNTSRITDIFVNCLKKIDGLQSHW
jgi:hypothetical protein